MRPLVVSLSALLCLAPAVARASGLDAPILGPGSSGPTSCDAAAVYWNPAALACVKKPELILGGALVLAYVSYTRDYRGSYQTPDTLDFKDPLGPGNVDTSKQGEAEPTWTVPFAPVGDLFVAYPLTSRFTLGGGAYVPYAAVLALDDDGPQAFQLRRAFIAISHVTVSLSGRILPELSVGAGLSYVGGFAELSKLQDFAALRELGEGLARDPIGQENDFGADAPTTVRELDALARPISFKKGLANGVTFNAGVLYAPTPDSALSLSYQHGASLTFHGELRIDMNDDFFTQDLAAQGIRYPPLVTGDADLDFNLPKRLTLGGRYRLNDAWTLSGSIAWVGYSAVDAFTVTARSKDLEQPKLGLGDTVTTTLPRDWNDTVALDAGARLRLTDTMTGWGHIGYQSPASPDHTIDVASPDGHRLLGGLGGELVVAEGWSLLGDLLVQGILPRTVTTSDYDLGNGTYGLVAVAGGGHLRIAF